MFLEYRQDWSVIRERYEAWWNGELLDRPLIQITSPLSSRSLDEIPLTNQLDSTGWFTDPAIVLPRLEQQVKTTYYAGDALPLVFPFDICLPAIEAAYLGCPYTIQNGTGWAGAIIQDWDNLPPTRVDATNPWWVTTQCLLTKGIQQAKNRYLVGLPDLQGGGEIIVLMRGTEKIALDLFDHPVEICRLLDEELNTWKYFYDACYQIIHPYQEGYIDWLGVWSMLPYATLENDFSTMISPQMFTTIFLPSLLQQLSNLKRSIFHLDGPGALPHLNSLLALPELNGIQWVIGPADGNMVDWISLLQKIQAAGKSVIINCQYWEVKRLIAELRPEKLLLSTTCSSKDEAESLITEIKNQF